ncbi:MAG: 30S ribosomal protein S20 [Pseudomonadota bacterium]
MANTVQARKRARQSEKRRQLRSSQRAMVRTYIKKVYSLLAEGSKTEAAEAYQRAVPVIDRMASKGVIHPNKADRHKSRLAQQIKQLSA